MDIITEQAGIPENGNERLAKLYGYNIVESHDNKGAFQHVMNMAARIFNVPIALVSFVDEKNVVAHTNIEIDGVGELSRDISLYSMAILKNEVTVFENAREEPCLLTNLMVYGSFGLQFYAGAPLTTPDGFHIGVLAVVDKKPRIFSKDDEALLEGLAAIVMEELEERLTLNS